MRRSKEDCATNIPRGIVFGQLDSFGQPFWDLQFITISVGIIHIDEDTTSFVNNSLAFSKNLDQIVDEFFHR